MPSIGSYQYPFHELSECTDMCKCIYSNSITTMTGLATQLGHKTTNSGGFLLKVSTLRLFGLLTPRGGDVALSELGKKVAKPRDDAEFKQAMRDAIGRVPILNEIKKKLNGRSPGENFWVDLHEITGADRKISEDAAPRIKRVYLDAEKYLDGQQTNEPSPERVGGDVGLMSAPIKPEVPGEKLVEFKDGSAYMRFPLDPNVIETLKGILDLYKKKAEKTK